MKLPGKRRWLLFMIWLIVFSNLAYFLLMQLKIKDQLIQKYITSYLKNALGAEVSIGNLSISDAFLLVEEISFSLPSQNLSFSAKSLHIEFKLSQLLWRHLQKTSLVERIFINDPVISYHFQPRPKDGDQTRKGKKKSLPDLARFFHELYLENGKVHFSLDVGAYRLKENFTEVSASLVPAQKSLLRLQGKTDNQAPFTAELDLSAGKFNHVRANVADYQPLDMYIVKIDSLQALYDLNFYYQPGLMKINAGAKNVHLEVVNLEISADSLAINGTNQELKIDFINPRAFDNKADLSCTLYDMASSDIAVDARLAASQVKIRDFQPWLEGYGRLEARMTGKFTDFNISSEAWLDTVSFQGQQFENVNLTALVKNSEVAFNLKNIEWLNNKVKANGFYKYSGASVINASADTLRYRLGEINLQGKVSASYNTGRQPSKLQVTDLAISTPLIRLDKLELNASLAADLINLDIHRVYNDLALQGFYDINSRNFQLNLDLRRFRTGQALAIYTFPSISGNLNCFGTPDSLNLSSNLRFYDQYFGKFDGRIKTSALLDFKNKTSSLELHTSNARYNFEELQADIIASGNLDSISTQVFTINQNLDLEATIFLKPELNWKLNLTEENIPLNEPLKYFLDYGSLQNVTGNFNLILDADSRQKGNFSAALSFADFQFGQISPLGLNLLLEGDNELIRVRTGKLFFADTQNGSLSGSFTLQPEFSSRLLLSLHNFDLSLLLPESDFKGFFNGEILFQSDQAGNTISAQAQASDLSAGKMKIDSLSLDLKQSDKLLTIDHISATLNKNSHFLASGAFGYNLLNANSYPSSDSLKIAFSGDLLKLLRQNLDYVREGRSKSDFNITANMDENGLYISSADLILKGSDLKLKDQLESWENITLDCRIRNNVFIINDFSARIGNGKLYIENSVGFNNRDLHLHLLNLGQFLIYTSDNGIRFHLPLYSPQDSFTSLALRGKDSRYLRLYQSADVPVLTGKIILNQADILYPPNSENLTKLLNSFTSDITKRWTTKGKNKTITPPVKVLEPDEYPLLPFDLDLLLVTGENVRYVTYPFQVNFMPESYIFLNYNEEKFNIPDANFISEEGRVEIVGVFLDVENIRISYNQNINNVSLEAFFSRKVADGTQIQLLITDEGEGSFPDNLKMALTSDNPYDLTDTEKLFRLRYGRGLDELTAVERNNLMQNDLIQTAGGEIENFIIDPVINKFELFVSRKLNVDYFQMETSFIYNLLSGNSELYGNQEDYARKYSADILLENLSFKAGKYIFNDLLLNYQITFQKTYETDLQTDLGIYHTFSFRYDMPMDIKFLYQYNIDPWEEDSHEYSFIRKVRFSDFADLFRKLVYPYKGQQRN